jgi:hypothetical protein
VSQITKDTPAPGIDDCTPEILSRQLRPGSHFAEDKIRFKIWNQGRPKGESNEL